MFRCSVCKKIISSSIGEVFIYDLDIQLTDRNPKKVIGDSTKPSAACMHGDLKALRVIKIHFNRLENVKKLCPISK